MRVRLKSKEIKECEFTNGNPTDVMELIYQRGDSKLKILIKDIDEETNHKSIERQARKKARDYFDNLNSGLINK